jgi:hypothetical protein
MFSLFRNSITLVIQTLIKPIMKKKFLIPGILVFALASCGGGEESSENESNESTEDTTAVEETAGRSAIDPFPDFPMVGLNASAGDIILTPS